MKLKFGDIAAKEQLVRAVREKRQFESRVSAAMVRIRNRYLNEIDRAKKYGVSASCLTYESVANDRDLLREFGAEALREAAKRLEAMGL